MYTSTVCERIENSDLTWTGPGWYHFMTGTGPKPDYKPEKFNRIRPDLPDFYRIYFKV